VKYDLAGLNQNHEWREKVIARIEGYTGSMSEMPYHIISTEDLHKILKAMMGEAAWRRFVLENTQL